MNISTFVGREQQNSTQLPIWTWIIVPYELMDLFEKRCLKLEKNMATKMGPFLVMHHVWVQIVTTLPQTAYSIIIILPPIKNQPLSESKLLLAYNYHYQLKCIVKFTHLLTEYTMEISSISGLSLQALGSFPTNNETIAHCTVPKKQLKATMVISAG